MIEYLKWLFKIGWECIDVNTERVFLAGESPHVKYTFTYKNKQTGENREVIRVIF